MPTIGDRLRAFINPPAPAKLANRPAGLANQRTGLANQPYGLANQPVGLAVTSRVADDPGWVSHSHAPGDRPYADIYADLEDTLEAWRKNFMVRRVVNLTRSYAVGSGITLGSADAQLAAFIDDFWMHPKNRIARRLGAICDHLTRDGELFPILFTNPADGVSYVRFKSARQIAEVVTNEDDYETELYYIEHLPDGRDRTWLSPQHPAAYLDPDLPPLMLHWAVNRPLDATRGESDLTPVLPWALRYSEWLKDRVRLNRQRTRAGVLDVMVADDAQVEAKRRQLRGTNPIEAGIYVHGPGEEVKLHSLRIEADDAEDDGLVLRLAIATGANLGLHYLGEGENANYATAKEMGEPTARFYADRQQDIIWFLQDLVSVAYRRYCNITGRRYPERLDFQVTVTEVARADNESLAQAARDIIQALVLAQDQGWIDDETALSLAMKFAGETLPAERIRDILAKAPVRRNVGPTANVGATPRGRPIRRPHRGNPPWSPNS